MYACIRSFQVIGTESARRTYLDSFHKLLYEPVVERLVHVDTLEMIWSKLAKESRSIYLDGAATLT